MSHRGGCGVWEKHRQREGIMESHPLKNEGGSPEPRPVCREVTVSKRKNRLQMSKEWEEQINVRQGLRTTADEVRDRIAKLGITESDVEEAVAEVRREAASENRQSEGNGRR